MIVCREGAEFAWMMFDGVFNEIEDIFCEDWAAQIYSIKGDCGTDQVGLAISDDVRHSTGWAQLVAKHRAWVLNHFPTLGARS